MIKSWLRLGAGGERGPILATGMPRSGTTWLGRVLATAPGTAMVGREPMNPGSGQYGLGRSLATWTELVEPTPDQVAALRRSYAAVNPLVFGRYGRRQWAAPLPWIRTIVKDPWAVLSVPAVVRLTGARAVVLYRHPGAALLSFRRMGWDPDLEDLLEVLTRHRARRGDNRPVTAAPPDPTERLGIFWSALYEIALDNADSDDRTVVVSHEEIAAGGVAAAAALFDVLGLVWSRRSEDELTRDANGRTGPANEAQLHNLRRDPADVARSWRNQLPSEDAAALSRVTGEVHERLERSRLPFS